MLSKEFLNEMFDPNTGFKTEWDDTFGPVEMHAVAKDREGRFIQIKFVPVTDDKSAIDIEFTRNDSHDVTGQGDAERVFATVLNAIKTYLTKYNRPWYILFSGKGSSRFKLYQRLVARFAEKFGYEPISHDKLPQDILEIPGLPKDIFALTRTQ